MLRLLLLLLPSLLVCGGVSKGVEVQLLAPWSGTSSLLEALEFVNGEDPRLFWHLVDVWQAKDVAAASTCWEAVTSTACDVLRADGAPTSACDRLHLSLTTRQHSPKVQVFRQMAASAPTPSVAACCWVRLIAAGSEDTFASTPEELRRWFEHRAGGASGDAPTSGEDSSFRLEEGLDHVYPGSHTGGNTAVLYGAPGTPCFQQLHDTLSSWMKQPEQRPSLAYVLRPVLPEACGAASGPGNSPGCVAFGHGGDLTLTGYDVELAVKNTEYSARDDSEVQQTQDVASSAPGTNTPPPGVLEPDVELRPLKPWQLHDIGLQATQYIMQAEDPLAAAVAVCQSLPSLATPLSRRPVATALRSEVAANQRVLPPGLSVLTVNGVAVDTPDLDIFKLQEVIATEMRLQHRLSKAGIPQPAIPTVLAARFRDDAPAPTPDRAPRLDVGADEHVLLLNDLEGGAAAVQLHPSLELLLADPMMYGGGMPPIAKNLFNVLLVVDPAHPLAASLTAQVHSLTTQGVTLTFAVLLRAPPLEAGGTADSPRPGSERSMSGQETVLRAVLATRLADGGAAAATLWRKTALSVAAGGAGAPPEDVAAALRDVFEELWDKLSGGDGAGGDCAFTSGRDAWRRLKSRELCEDALEESLQDHLEYVSGRGLQRLPPTPHVFLNGIILGEVDEDSLTQVLMTHLQPEIAHLQQLVRQGKLLDGRPTLKQILKGSGAVRRHNPRLVGDAEPEEVYHVAVDSIVSPGVAGRGWRYLHPPGSRPPPGELPAAKHTKLVSHWVVGDVCDRDGGAAQLFEAAAAAASLKRSKRARFALLFAGRVGEQVGAASNLHLLMDVLTQRAAGGGSDATAVPAAVHEVLADGWLRAALCGSTDPSDAAMRDALKQAANALEVEAGDLQGELRDGGTVAAEMAAGSNMLQERLQLAPTDAAVVTNGRVVRLRGGAAGQIQQEDFQLLESLALAASPAPKPLLKALAAVLPHLGHGAAAEDLLLLVVSLLADPDGVRAHAAMMSAHIRAARAELQELHTSLHIPPSDPDAQAVEVFAVLDPLSTAAQRLLPLLQLLRTALNVGVRITLAPATQLEALPLRTFSTFALPEVDATGVPAPIIARLDTLPPDHVLTLNMRVPEAWLVAAGRTRHDLDNLKLADLGAAPTLQATFTLDAILLTGRCTDSSAMSEEGHHPRGVQMILGNASHPYVDDTLVMQNLGYFQLAAAPGVWHLRLAPGRSDAMFTIQGDHTTDGSGARVLLSDWSGRHVQLPLLRSPGWEGEDVLGEGSGPPAHAHDAPSAAGKELQEPEDVINIFTVASGHMYERLQKIMILSVLRHTRRPVKFWFISNYMSPQMRAFIPHMAVEYGFQVEFVTYKWPSWLHPQTEKQRIIWAYKILFLDVLFPLHVKRVIFVDADQVVRADLGELVDMDLQGAPVAYTPFCNGQDGDQMDGYRFWKTGFWETHLRGRPYHISALYVVDVTRFRHLAAGDAYRVAYDSLSRDPNSLSNLDQDLPNYMQHQVPIHSLPQEWLWCESWCGANTKASAKTIDLCNNPDTKEPKLQAARRIVAEWPALDEEARQFTQRIDAQLRAASPGDGGGVSVSMDSTNQETLLTEATGGPSSPETPSEVESTTAATLQNPHDEL